MANQVDARILEEGHRNATVRITAFMDTSDVSLTPAFAVTSFVANDPNQSKLLGFRVDWLQYAVDPDIVVRLYWNAAAPQLIATLADSNDLIFKKGSGLLPANMLAAGFDGSINCSTAGYSAGANTGFTCIMTLTKLYQL
jgi:hypothetical protein